jgi:predicted transcriptional regulator
MKRAMNVRLEENIILTLEKLSREMHTTKTDVIEKAIQLFSKQKSKKNNELMQYAGVLDTSEADNILESIKNNKSSKDFTMDL